MASAQKQTFYEELGIPPDIEQAELKRTLKKKALEYHPDKHPQEEKDEWTEKFQRLQQIMETFQDETSRLVYDQIHLSRERTARVLLLMDMNGSLLCKLSKNGKDGRPLHDAGQPDFIDKDYMFWVRPHAKEFLEALLDPRSNVAFAIYTSRQFRNAEPQVQSLFGSIGRPGLERSLFAVFAGDAFSVPDPAAGPYKSKRSLPRIWRDPKTCAHRGIRFDECNTVNLDSESSKLKEHPKNGILVPNYGLNELGRDDHVLVALKDYLLRLAKESHGDVREYMRLFPFSQNGILKPRALPPVELFMKDSTRDDDGEIDDLTEKISNFTIGQPLPRPPGTKGGPSEIASEGKGGRSSGYSGAESRDSKHLEYHDEI